MRKTLRGAALGAVCVCLALGAARADDKDRPVKEGGKEGGDATFVMKASESDMAEITLSSLALKNASSGEVKKFADQMIKDHTKTSKELKELAGKKKLALAKGLNEEHEAMRQKLAKLKGAEFDKAYMEGQVDSHKKAVALFEEQSKSGSDAELKAWAGKTLPGLKHHLKMAEKLADGKGEKTAKDH